MDELKKEKFCSSNLSAATRKLMYILRTVQSSFKNFNCEAMSDDTQIIIIYTQNIYKDCEHSEAATCKQYLRVQIEGNRTVKRSFEITPMYIEEMLTNLAKR